VAVKRVRALSLFVLLIAAPLHAETSPCPEYNKPVTLTGTISVVTQHNRDILPPVERYLLLKLDKPLCTIDSADDQGEFGQWAVQLLYSPPGEALTTNDQIIARRPPWISGAHVAATGTLFHADTVHHHTPVMLEASNVRVLGR
jgi:hypothetical protein